jgi:hypothetical protein
MSAATHEVPFELAFRGKGVWRAYWAEQKLVVEVSGTEEAPDRARIATLADVVARWSEVKQGIATFVRGLAPEHLVLLDPPGNGGFAARSCGFDGDLVFQGIGVTTDDAPRRVVAIFYTGHPDGYATYAVVLEGDTPTAISAFAS